MKFSVLICISTSVNARRVKQKRDEILWPRPQYVILICDTAWSNNYDYKKNWINQKSIYKFTMLVPGFLYKARFSWIFSSLLYTPFTLISRSSSPKTSIIVGVSTIICKTLYHDLQMQNKLWQYICKNKIRFLWLFKEQTKMIVKYSLKVVWF